MLSSPRYMRFPKMRFGTAACLAVCLAVGLCLLVSSCREQVVAPVAGEGDQSESSPSDAPASEPNPLAYVDPSVRAWSLDVESLLGFQSGFSPVSQHSLSPDGKYILGTVESTGKREIVSIPLEEGAEALTLASLPVGEQGQDISAVLPLGWTSSGEAVYLLEGIQPFGPHKGNPGIGVYLQKPAGLPQEAGFIAPGLLRGRCWLVPESRSAFLQVAQALWRVDLLLGGAEEVISNLPSYDGLFNPVLSPDGSHFVYRLHEESKSGIYVLDTRTKVESPLLPDGESMSFFPQWSPDGRWVAAYTVQRDPAHPEESAYQEFGDVDGPMPISSSLTVVDSRGSARQEITISGWLLSDFRWSADGRALSFQAGGIQPSGMVVPAVQWVQNSLWVAPVNNDVMWTTLIPEKVADLPQASPSWFSHLPVPGGKTVYYSPDGKRVLRAAPGVSPVEVAGSATFRPADLTGWRATYPVAGDLAAGWMWPKGSQTQSLWVFGANGAREVAEYSRTDEFNARVVTCGNGLLVVHRSDRKTDPSGQLDVFNFDPEVFVPRYAEDDPLSRVKAAVDRYVTESNLGNEIVRCVEVSQDYYLVELKARKDEFFYLYVDKEGNQAKPAASHANRPAFIRCEGGEAWFECDWRADNYTTFPYYEVTSPDPLRSWTVPLFKAPGDNSYEVSHTGLAYQVSDMEVWDTGIRIRMDVTGPGKGGVMAGGTRPPKTYIAESGQNVTFRFVETLLPEPLKERLSSYAGNGAGVVGVTSQGDYSEVVVEVPGEYSFFIGGTGSTPPASTGANSDWGAVVVSMLFRSAAEDCSFDARKVAVGDSVGDLEISSIDDLNERQLNGKQIYSARVKFSGQITLTGTYFHNPTTAGSFPDPLDCQFRFHPDSESAARLPRLEDDTRFPWFALANHGQAEEELGPPGSTGKATIVISEYTINHTYSDEYNHAGLERVVVK